MQKSKILAFLLALVVSIVLWFYAVTVVNPDDTITISGISVQFEGTEALTSQGLMLTGGDSTKVSIKVSGRRSDLKAVSYTHLSGTAGFSHRSFLFPASASPPPGTSWRAARASTSSPLRNSLLPARRCPRLISRT